MLVSVRHKLVILAMPKCGSSALHASLAGHADMILRGAPGIKHTTFRKYDRFLRPYLETLTKTPPEVVCLFREPLDWLHSWWRYRARDNMPNPENSTRHLGFDAFVEAYLDNMQKPADVGRQSRFVARPDGTVGVDRIFRHDRMDCFVGFLENRLEIRLTLDWHNVSPAAGSPDELSPTTRTAAMEALARDYEIYETLAE